jgi:hypothetical protein
VHRLPGLAMSDRVAQMLYVVVLGALLGTLAYGITR